MPSGREKNDYVFHKEALGGIVTANVLFSGAVFLSVTGTVTPMSGIPNNCVAGDDMTLNLFLFQVWSLGFYFRSSLIAAAAKLVVVYFERTTEGLSPGDEPPCLFAEPPAWLNSGDQGGENEDVCSWERREYQFQSRNPPPTRHWNNREKVAVATKLSPYVRPVMISSAVFTAVGSFFLVLSIINMVQIRLGLVSCGNTLVVITAVGTPLLIFIGLGVHLCMSWYFFKRVL